MKKVLVFAKNYEKYNSGYYHQDIVDALATNTEMIIYGPGYPGYEKDDSLYEVLQKKQLTEAQIDLIVFVTSWDEDGSTDTVDPHPKIDVSSSKCVKIYFLNKEYKKLEQRFDYIRRQKIDLVVTVHPQATEWQRNLGVRFLQLPFGISLSRFRDRGLKRKYDFAFTGGLHATHNDLRYSVKKRLFKTQFHHIKSNKGFSGFFKKAICEEYSRLNIYWAEWGARSLVGKSLLPSGEKYSEFMNSCKVFLNTPSALGIFNTRFFELMSTRTLILCPEDEPNGRAD